MISKSRPRTKVSILCTLSLLFLLTALNASRLPADTAESNAGIARAESLLAAGDTLAAISELNSLIKIHKDKGKLFLLLGRIHLARGEGGKALSDFRRVTDSPEKQMRLVGWLGLSKTYRTVYRDILRAERACRTGLSVDGNNPELLYERAMIGFSYGGSEGYGQAGESLVKLIEIDPTFGNVYRMWRDSLLFHPVYDNGRVSRAMKSWFEVHPDSTGWQVEIAWDEFLAGRSDSALAVLGRLEKARPDFDNADRELLLARCRLDAGDSLGFQELYRKALKIAEERNEDTRAFAETELAITKSNAALWEECFTSLEKASFLRSFWLEIELDPIDPLRRRLIEHYRRLRHAELNYPLRNPHSFYQSSENYNRLLAPQSNYYDYDTDLMRNQSTVLRLDPRGVVYMRLGDPGKIEKHLNSGLVISDELFRSFSAGSMQLKNKGVVQYEYWYYEGIPLLFAEMKGMGDYVYIPNPTSRNNFIDMMSVLKGRRWDDKPVYYTLEYYVAQFLASNSADNEVEFYQQDRLPKGERPSATIAVYDKYWNEIERRDGDVFRIGEDQDTDHWLARHRITVLPGLYHYTIRMASKDERWLGKGALEFVPFNLDSLQLSAVVLGAEPQEGRESPDRTGVSFIPRTNIRFGRGEPMSVFFELYGLSPDSTGRRHYKEWINVVKLEEGESRVKKYIGTFFQLLNFNSEDNRSAVSLSFDREADWRDDRAPESFTFDTSALDRGNYRLVLQVQDKVSGMWDVEEVFFDIGLDWTQVQR